MFFLQNSHTISFFSIALEKTTNLPSRMQADALPPPNRPTIEGPLFPYTIHVHKACPVISWTKSPRLKDMPYFCLTEVSEQINKYTKLTIAMSNTMQV